MELKEKEMQWLSPSRKRKSHAMQQKRTTISVHVCLALCQSKAAGTRRVSPKKNLKVKE
jgi:hypothetical protein